MEEKIKGDLYELGNVENLEDLDKALITQFKAHGMTDKEIKKWFEETGEVVSMDFIKSIKID
jgi:hypothetical protein